MSAMPVSLGWTSGYYYRLNKSTNYLEGPIYGDLIPTLNPSTDYYYDVDFYCSINGRQRILIVNSKEGAVKCGSVDCLWLKEPDEGKAYKLFYEFYKEKYEKKINVMLARLNDIKINAKVLANTEVDI